jgi:hypothetical protein
MMVAISEMMVQSQSGQIYYTLFWRCTMFIVPYASSHCKLCNYAEPKSFSQSQTGFILTFSSSNFIVQGYTLSMLEMLFQD